VLRPEQEGRRQGHGESRVATKSHTHTRVAGRCLFAFQLFQKACLGTEKELALAQQPRSPMPPSVLASLQSCVIEAIPGFTLARLITPHPCSESSLFRSLVRQHTASLVLYILAAILAIAGLALALSAYFNVLAAA
jgi:hypothetical protein